VVEKPAQKKLWQSKLTKLSTLTPGDFATVVRKNRISGQKLCPENVLKGLVEEVAFKEGALNRHIGFLAQ